MKAGARRRAAVALMLGAATVLIGCTSGSGSEQADGASADSAAVAPAEESTRGQGDAPGHSKDAGGLSRAQVTDRKLVRSATLDVRTGDVAAAAAKARDEVRRAGGYSASEEVGTDSAKLTLTVPSERFEPVLDRLAALGQVHSRELRVDDVTDQVVDVDSRVASQRASVTRLRALLDRAGTISDIVAIEGELTARESELEALLARQESLKGMVAMSDIHLSISATDTAGAGTDEGGFVAGMANGWDAFLGTVGVLLSVLGAALPFLVAFGIPAGLLLWWFRRRRRPGQRS